MRHRTKASPPPKAESAARPGEFPPLAAVFLALPIYEIGRSLLAHNYVEQAALVHGQTLFGLQWGCWILAGALLLSAPFRRSLRRHLDDDGRRGPWRQSNALTASLAVTALLCFLMYCRYRGSQLPLDTAAIVQRVFNTAHGNWFQSSIFGCNSFSYHVAFTLDLFSPLLLIWQSSLPLLMLQCVALGSLGLAAYHLVYRLTSSSYAAFVGMLLVYSSPAFSQMCASRLDDSVFLAPFLLWALVFMEYELWGWCVAFMALAATTREHFPFTLLALGVYAAFRRGRPTVSSSLTGAAIAAGAVLLFVVEMKLIFSFPDALGYQRSSWDGYFHRYGFAGRDHLEFAAFLLRHPLATVSKTILPFEQNAPILSLILFSALLPLAAPLQFIPFFIAVIPQMMTEPGPLHDMLFNYPSLVFGLLMFAAAHGLARVLGMLEKRGWSEYLLIPVLVVSGFGFRGSKNPIMSGWQSDMFDSTSRFASLIPPNASLWTDEFLGAWVAARTQLKLASGYPDFNRPDFERKLFKPDYAAFQIGWLVHNTSRAPILLYLADHHYVLAGGVPGIAVLKSPDDPRPGEISAPAALPVPTQEQMKAFHHFAIVIQHIQAGEEIAVASYANLTPEERRIEEFCVYLTGSPADPIRRLLRETAPREAAR